MTIMNLTPEEKRQYLSFLSDALEKVGLIYQHGELLTCFAHIDEDDKKPVELVDLVVNVTFRINEKRYPAGAID